MISATAYHVGKFLSQDQLLGESRNCSWCGYSGERKRVLALQKSPDVYLLSCPGCHGISSSRVATASAIDAYYATYYSETQESLVTCGNPERFARHICRGVQIDAAGSTVRVLDFGGGDGSIGEAVGRIVAERTGAAAAITVVDYNAQLVTPKSPRISLVHEPDLTKISSGPGFHVVLASGILEHLPEPADVTRRLLRSLVHGGYFYARTPTVVPLLRMLKRFGIAIDFTFPAHFHDLGQAFWENVINTLGLATSEWRIVRSRPSLVETSFSEHFLRTIAAYTLKAPWWVFGSNYTFTGGWEVLIQHER